MSTILRPADPAAHDDAAARLGRDLADRRRAGAERMGAQQRERLVGPLARDEREELPLVGHVQRIEPEDLARAADLVAHRQGRLVEPDADPGRRRDLVQRAGHPAAGRIAQHVNVRAERPEQDLDDPVSAAVSLAIVGLEGEALAHRQDRDPVIGDRAVDDHDVPRPRATRIDVDPRRDHAEPRGVDEQAVALAAIDDLGVPGDDRDRRPRRRPRASTRRSARAPPSAALPRG